MNTYTFRVSGLFVVEAATQDEAIDQLPDGLEWEEIVNVEHGDLDCTAPSYDDVRRETERKEAE